MNGKEYDVIVAGGGLAGCAAAVASARLGRKTALVEQSGVLGGQASLGLVTPMGSVFANKDGNGGEGEPFGGICAEIYNEACALTLKYAAAPDWDTGKVQINPHITKYVLLSKCIGCGVDVMFHTTLAGAVCENDEIKKITVVSKSGMSDIYAKAFVDCTGDADLVYISGAPYKLGAEEEAYKQLADEGLAKSHVDTLLKKDEHGKKSHGVRGRLQPVSIFFRMGGVDAEKAMMFNNKALTYENMNVDREEFEKLPYYNSCGFEACGERLPMPQGRVLVTYGSIPDTVAVNMSRVINIDGSDAQSLNRGEYLAQMQIINIIDFLRRYIPGFENSYLLESASTLGVRESRRMTGKYTLSAADVIECKRFDDAVARGSYIIDIHNPGGSSSGAIGGRIKGDYYEIPLRCLMSEKINNLFAAGRCISADHVAHSSSRVQGTCLMTGQAAGTAAAIASSGIIPDKDNVRDILIKEGAVS